MTTCLNFFFRITFSFLLIISSVKFSFAQQEANNWYFGNNAGITFNTSPASALTNGALTAREGCASISDVNGNLLFYSNGLTVWNRNHTIMPNGTGLLGASTSTQSSLIVKQPGSANLYYIFTVPDQAASGRYTYSIVDMTLNGGLGDIVTSSKNLNLLTNFSNPSTVFNATEALTATYHSNQTDIWVIVHEYNTNRFYSFLLTASGIQNPVSSSVGVLNSYLGQCRLSPDGTKIALGGYFGAGAELSSFNPTTGVITNPIVVVPNGTRIYGLSFSPNSNVLYVTDDGAGIWQYDATQTTSATIQASRYMVGTGTGFAYPQMQLGPDKKIYIAQNGRSFLATITFPDVLGVGCTFADNGISLGGRTSQLGLPTFMVNYVTPRPPLVSLGNDTTLCPSATILLDAKNPGATYLWNTGAQTQTITVSQAGTYFVDVTSNGLTTRDEIIISYVQFSSLNIPLTYYFCKSTEVSFDLNPTFAEVDYLWSDGSSTVPFTVTDPGAYWLERKINNCTKHDDFTVVSNCVTLGKDSTLCATESILLDAGYPGATYLWSTGEQTQTIIVTQAATYHVDVTWNGVTASDDIVVSYAQFSTLNIPVAYTFCKTSEAPFDLNPVFSETDYQWSDGSSTMPFTITDPGNYWLERTVGRCVQHDDISVASNCPVLPMLIPNLITINGDALNDKFYIDNLPENVWSVVIYNRWGSVVYRQSPYQNDWDCENTAEGMYFYELYRPDSDQKYKGWVQVIK